MLSPDDVILSQLQAISQLFLSYPASEEFCQVSELTIQTKNGRGWEECLFELVKLGLKSLGDGHQDICKDKDCNLVPVAGY